MSELRSEDLIAFIRAVEANPPRRFIPLHEWMGLPEDHPRVEAAARWIKSREGRRTPSMLRRVFSQFRE